jgi:4-amino-4-deoxy-L-arabinose transferase-like glycosyltransferase
MISYVTIVSALALAARIWWAMNVPTTQLYDFAAYQALAENIAAGRGHTMDGVPVAWQGCGYPYLLGFFYRAIGSVDIFWGKILNIALSMATLPFAYLIYRKLFDKRRHAAAALTITAFLPQYVSYVNVIGTEIFFTFLMSAVIFAQLYLFKGRRRWIAAAAVGLATGAAALTRPFMLAYPVICGVVMFASGKKWRDTLVLTGIAALGVVLTVTPWAYRNYRLFGRLIPVSYNSGYCLYTNNNDANVNGAWMDLSAAAGSDELSTAIGEALEDGARSVKAAPELDPYLSAAAGEWIADNPAEFLKLGALRVYRTFFVGVNDIEQWAMNGCAPPEGASESETLLYARNYNLVISVFNSITYILNAAGFIFVFASSARFFRDLFSRRQCGLMPSLLIVNIAFFALVSFVYGGEARYAFPVFVFMIPALVAASAGFYGLYPSNVKKTC